MNVVVQSYTLLSPNTTGPICESDNVRPNVTFILPDAELSFAGEATHAVLLPQLPAPPCTGTNDLRQVWLLYTQHPSPSPPL